MSIFKHLGIKKPDELFAEAIDLAEKHDISVTTLAQFLVMIKWIQPGMYNKTLKISKLLTKKRTPSTSKVN